MRLQMTSVLIAVAGPVSAHPGHLADLAGHDHWVAGAAIGAAVIVGLWGKLKGKRKDEGSEAEPEMEEEAA